MQNMNVSFIFHFQEVYAFLKLFFTVRCKTSYAGSTVCVIPKIHIFSFGNVENTLKKVVLKSQRV